MGAGTGTGDGHRGGTRRTVRARTGTPSTWVTTSPKEKGNGLRPAALAGSTRRTSTPPSVRGPRSPAMLTWTPPPPTPHPEKGA